MVSFNLVFAALELSYFPPVGLAADKTTFALYFLAALLKFCE